MKRKKDPVGETDWLRAALAGASFAMLSFYQIVVNSRFPVTIRGWMVVVTVLTAFACGACFFDAAGRAVLAFARRSPAMAAASLFFSYAILRRQYAHIGAPRYDFFLGPLPFHVYRPLYWALALPALWFLLLWLIKKSRSFLTDFWAGMDRTDKRIYLAVTAAAGVLVLTAYSWEPQWYTQFDNAYSLDSSGCIELFLRIPGYYYIQHPMLGFLTFPIRAAVSGFLGLFAPENLAESLMIVCMQLLNVQFLLLSGFMIARRAQSRWTLALYLASMPVLLFGLSYEKYQLMVFLMVLYVYLRTGEPAAPPRLHREKGRTPGEKRAVERFLMEGGGHELVLMLSVGAMPITGFLYLYELFRPEKAREKLRSICRTAAWGVLYVVCSGRVHMLGVAEILGDAGNSLHAAGLKGFTPAQCLAAFMNFIQGSFVALSSEAGEKYLWTGILDRVPLLSVVILALMLAGAALRRREPFVRYCALWLAGAAALMFAAQWAVHESPLFSILFSWALIPLFQKGFQALVERFRWRERAAYGCVLVSMLAVNVLTMFQVAQFLRGL